LPARSAPGQPRRHAPGSSSSAGHERSATLSWRAAATLLLVSWGALAFGAVYAWAFIPLFTGCAITGLVAWLGPGGRTGKAEGAALALLVGAIGLQLVPLPDQLIRFLSPETDAILQRYVLGYPVSVHGHPLSIRPAATALAFAAAAALALLFVGLARTLTRRDARYIAGGVSVLGAVMALAGLVQKATWNGKIYGLWQPEQAGESFGPFVNRNHFAGWMLMAIPLTLAYFSARISRGTAHLKPAWRNRLLWLSSPEANQTILVGFAAFAMAVALMFTMSRSGILGLMAGLTLAGVALGRRGTTGAERAAAAGLLIFVAVAAIWWTGLDRLVLRFSEREAAGGGRLGIWADTWRIARLFPVTGTGLNTFGSATIFYQTSNPLLHFAETHNDYLQLLAEGGALVCVPAAFAIFAMARSVRQKLGRSSEDPSDYWIRVGAVIGIVSVALQETVDFSLQMPGNATLFVVLLALAARRTRDHSSGIPV
jgi:O-antigen ligase